MLYTPRSEERNTAWFKMAWHSTLAAHSAPGHSDRAQSYLYCRINCRLTLVDTCGAVEHLCETLPGRFEIPSPPPTNTHRPFLLQVPNLPCRVVTSTTGYSPLSIGTLTKTTGMYLYLCPCDCMYGYTATLRDWQTYTVCGYQTDNERMLAKHLLVRAAFKARYLGKTPDGLKD